MVGKFYTPQTVADLMISRIPAVDPQRIVDICAGSGNLLFAAQRKWAKAIIYAIDEDPSTLKYFKSKNDINFVLGDGRSKVFDRHLNGRCDVVLANPPFAKAGSPVPKRFEAFVRNSNEICHRVIKRLDTSMLIANLQALAPNGYLGAIVPNGLLNAIAWKPLREFLLKKYEVIEIINLPRVFEKADVQSSILIIKNQLPKKNNKVMISTSCVNNSESSIRASKKVYRRALTERMDANYYHRNRDILVKKEYSLDKLPITLRRGCYSMANSKSRGYIRILHSTSIGKNSEIGGKNYFLHKKDLKRGIVCESKPGDILFVRVGKTLGRTGIVGEKYRAALISDCLFRIRLPDNHSPTILFDYLRSEDAIIYIRSLARGTAANYVTKKDLLSLPLPDFVVKYYLFG